MVIYNTTHNDAHTDTQTDTLTHADRSLHANRLKHSSHNDEIKGVLRANGIRSNFRGVARLDFSIVATAFEALICQ